jgi:uncharacterized protein (TIRG00374 family)
MRRVVGLARQPWIRYAVASLATVAVVVLLVVPQFHSAAHDLPLLKRISIGWIVAGVLFEVVSFMAYGLFTRGVLPPRGRPRYHRLLRIDVIGSALTHLLPGGGAAASGLRFKMLRDAGVDGGDAALGSVLQGMGSGLVVNAMLVVGALLVLPFRGVGGNPLYLVGAAIGVGHICLIAILWLGLMRYEEGSVRIARRAAARWHRSDTLERAVRGVAGRLRQLAAHPQMLVRAVLWSLANWLFDAASLWVFLLAFGNRVGFGDLLLAFGLAHTLAILPITPGGVGIIEGILVPALVGFGTPMSIALLGVLTWRLFNFWAPIPIGALAWLSLRLGRPNRPEPAEPAGPIEAGAPVETGAPVEPAGPALLV